MDSKKKRPSAVDKSAGTTVDMGDDLLKEANPNAQGAESNDEKIIRAEIMISEKLFDDAKKVLREILKKDSQNALVKEKLLEIQKFEIQELLASEGPRKKINLQKNAEPNESLEDVVERLERDHLLNFGNLDLKIVPDLFPTKVAYDKYNDRVVSEVVQLAIKNRIDVGVAHMEMGLYEVAVAVFETVVRYEEQKLEGTYLLCLSLIHANRAIEATIRLEPLARDMTLPENYKTDFLYLMALAFEKLGDLRKAKEFYRRTQMLNPRYRDVAEKLIEMK